MRRIESKGLEVVFKKGSDEIRMSRKCLQLENELVTCKLFVFQKGMTAETTTDDKKNSG